MMSWLKPRPTKTLKLLRAFVLAFIMFWLAAVIPRRRRRPDGRAGPCGWRGRWLPVRGRRIAGRRQRRRQFPSRESWGRDAAPARPDARVAGAAASVGNAKYILRRRARARAGVRFARAAR